MEWNIFDKWLDIRLYRQMKALVYLTCSKEDKYGLTVDGKPFTFTFSALKEELQKNTVHLKPDQRIRLDGKEAVIREVAINSVTSYIGLECNEFSTLQVTA